MADVWLGACRHELRDEVEHALVGAVGNVCVVWKDSALSLRRAVSESSVLAGAVVGPLDHDVSPLNLAAALVQDAMAAQVALAVPGVSAGLAARAGQAGITRLLDLTQGALSKPADVDDLDEPAVSPDCTPTVLLGTFSSVEPVARRVPVVEECRDVSEDALRRQQTLPPVVARPVVEEPKDPVDATLLFGGGADGADVRKEQSLRLAPVAASGGPLIAFVSGRGGVGKTSLAAAMGYAADSWGMQVALVDLDLAFGNLYACLGVSAPADLSPLSSPELLDEEGFLDLGINVFGQSAVWGGCERPEMSETVQPAVETLLKTLKARYDLVLVDTGPGLGDATAQAAQMSERLAICVDERAGTARAQARWASLAVRLGVARTRIVRLANRVGPRGRGEPRINRADVGLETARALRVLDGGSEVGDCMAEGKPEDLFALGSRFADSSATCLAVLLSELGALPQHPAAQEALERRNERARWTFGRRREAV